MSNEVKRAIDGGLSGLTVSERQIRAIMRMTRTEAAPPPRRKHRFVPVLAALMVMLIVGVSAILPGVSGPQDDLTSQVPTGQQGGFSSVNPALAEQEGDPSPEDGEGDTPVAPPESAAPTATMMPEPVPTPTATHLDIATRTDLTIPAPTATPTMAPTATSTPVVTPAPTATPTMAPTATPTMVPTATPTMVPTATPTMAPTATPTPVVTPAPTATPTPAPTATPAPLTMPAQEEVLYEDDRLAVTLVHSEFDTAGTSVQLRVLPKEPGKLVLTTDPAATAQDDRALLHLAAQADAFDSASVKTADWKSAQDMASQQEGRLCSMATTWTQQLDGSYLLQADGLMVYHFDQQVSVYVALTLTDSDAASSELLFRLESPRLTGFSEDTNWGFFRVEQSTSAFNDNSTTVYQHDSGYFATIRFKYTKSLPEDAMICINNVNGTDGAYGAGQIAGYGNDSRDDVLAARIICHGMPEELRTMAIEAYDRSSGEILFRVMYRQEHYQGVPPTLAPMPTVTAAMETPAPAPTLPDFTPAPIPTVTPVPDMILYSDDRVTLTGKARSFDGVHAQAELLLTAEDALQPGDVTASLRVVDPDDVEHSPQEMQVQCEAVDGGVRILLSADSVQFFGRSVEAAGTITLTGEDGQETLCKIRLPLGDQVSPVTSGNLLAGERPKKYSHYKGRLYAFGDYAYVNADFRYHDALLAGTQIQLASVDGVEGDFGSITLTQDVPGGELLSARIRAEGLPAKVHSFLCRVISPDGEPIFDFELKTEVVLPIRNESFNPNDPWYGDDYDLLDGLKPLYTPNGWAVGAPSTTKPPSYFDWITDGMQSGPNIDYGFGFGGW